MPFDFIPSFYFIPFSQFHNVLSISVNWLMEFPSMHFFSFPLYACPSISFHKRDFQVMPLKMSVKSNQRISVTQPVCSKWNSCVNSCVNCNERHLTRGACILKSPLHDKCLINVAITSFHKLLTELLAESLLPDSNNCSELQAAGCS